MGKNLVILILTFFAALQNASAQHNALFQTQEVLEIDAYADMETVLTDIGEERTWHNATLIYYEGDREVRLDAEFQSRGHFRRRPDICSFPPMRVNFKKEQIAGTLFEGSDKVKLVTHCNTNDKSGNRNVLTEFLIYRIYNQISDVSFRVRLCRITYHDILGTYPPVRRYAFFIEKTKNLAKRNNMVEIEPESISHTQLDKQAFAKFSIFQFLIGNSDWSVLLPQNIKTLTPADTSEIVPVPYDFDLSKMVAPAYATKKHGFDYAENEVKIKAYCQSPEDYEPAIKEFLRKEPLIIALIENFILMKKKERKRIVSFLQERFNDLENREIMREKFINYCND